MSFPPKGFNNLTAPRSGKGSLSPIIKLTPSSTSPSNLSNTNIRLENAADQVGIEKLYLKSFGNTAPAGPVSYLREATIAAPDLCLIAEDRGEIVGTLRFWPVMIGPVTPALLLGPIAVAPGWHARGLGAQMINLGLGRARDLGHRIVLLVGDGPYYGRFGFTRHLTQGVMLATPVEPERFLGLELIPGAMHGASGDVRPALVMDSTSQAARVRA